MTSVVVHRDGGSEVLRILRGQLVGGASVGTILIKKRNVRTDRVDIFDTVRDAGDVVIDAVDCRTTHAKDAVVDIWGGDIRTNAVINDIRGHFQNVPKSGLYRKAKANQASTRIN